MDTQDHVNKLHSKSNYFSHGGTNYRDEIVAESNANGLSVKVEIGINKDEFDEDLLQSLLRCATLMLEAAHQVRSIMKTRKQLKQMQRKEAA